jgi:hypothetical protein
MFAADAGLARAAIASAILATSLLGARSARAAESPEPANAEKLFLEGRDLITAGDYTTGCPKIAESYRLDPALGTLLALALCHEHDGRLGSAMRAFEQLKAGAATDGRSDRADFARARLAALDARTPRLTIRVPPVIRAASAEVLLNGEAIPAAAWDTALPVDPGPQRVEARATGFAPFVAKVDAPLGARAEITLALVPNGDHAAEAGPDGRRILGYGLGGTGVVALGLGAYFGIHALALMSHVRETCPPPGPCPDPSRVDESQSAVTSARVADVAVGAGLALVAVGAYLVFVHPAPQDKTVAVGPGGAMVSFRGL